jgi:PAP2 superfamily
VSAYSAISAAAERSTAAQLRPTDGCSAGRISSEAAVKWLLVAVIGSVVGIWMAWGGFQIGHGFLQAFGWISLLILISLFYFYTGRDQRILEFAHFGAQYLSLLAVLMPLSYLAVSTNAPVFDSEFDAIDKAMGLDWVAWTEWVIAHPTLRRSLSLVYDSLPIQALVCYIYNVHTRASWRNSEIWWITLISALITIAGSGAFPATNPYVYYGLESTDNFVHMKHFLALRDGTMRVIGLANAQGLIQLPSFHAVLAIMLTYNLRHSRWLFAPAVVLNTVLILSCPTEGSHYFIDLFIGAAVAAATIWGVRRLQRHFNARAARLRVTTTECAVPGAAPRVPQYE